MTSPSKGGASVTDAPPVPAARVSLLADGVPDPAQWIRFRPDLAGTLVNLDSALSGRAPGFPLVGVPDRGDVVIGTIAGEDDARSRAAIQDLVTRVDAVLTAAPAASPAPPGDPTTLAVRLRTARVDKLTDPRKHNALLVLSTIEWFPSREEIVSRIEQAILRELGDDASRRFKDFLPWKEAVARNRRSAQQQSIEEFLRFVQEHGMSRIRLRIALDWLESMSRAIADEAAQAKALRYVGGIRELVDRARTLDEVVPVGDLGDIRPGAWTGATFANTLPLVPRADCEIAEGSADGEEGLPRRGHERSERHEESSGRPLTVYRRNVTYLARFNATGPAAGGAPCLTTMESGWNLLSARLKDGRLEQKTTMTPLDPGRVLRAVERQAVIRALAQYASGESTSVIDSLRGTLEQLSGDDQARNAALRKLIEQNDPHLAGGVHAQVEALSEELALVAGQMRGGQLPPSSWVLRVDREAFHDSERSPFVAPRGEGAASSGPPWDWMKCLRVTRGETDADAALRLLVRVQADPLVLSWKDKGADRTVTREHASTLTLVLCHPQTRDADKKLQQSLLQELGANCPDLAMVFPRSGERPERFDPDSPLRDAHHRARTAAAVLLARVVIDRWLARVDPKAERSLRLITVYNHSKVEDDVADATLRAISRALDSTCGSRPVISQGVVLEESDSASYRVTAARRSLDSIGPITTERSDGEEASVGVIVLGGRQVECVRTESGRPSENEGRSDLLWGSSYFVKGQGPSLRVERLGNIAGVARLNDHWPGAIVEAIDAMRKRGASMVAIVARRTFERRTFRSEVRNQFYDAELPFQLLSEQPACEGVKLVGMVYDGILSVPADWRSGTKANDSLYLIADGDELAGTTTFDGLRPLVAIATNRTVKATASDAGKRGARGERRIGFRRRVDLYIERTHTGEPLTEAERRLLTGAFVGIHLVEGETVRKGRTAADADVLVPVLRAQRVFDVQRQPDAGELTWQVNHAKTTINFVALASAIHSVVEAGHGATVAR